MEELIYRGMLKGSQGKVLGEERFYKRLYPTGLCRFLRMRDGEAGVCEGTGRARV